MHKIRISAVSYLNTYPFLYGIYNDKDLMKKIELTTDYPSLCAKKLLNDNVDVGLVPVAILPQLSDYEIISDYCIAAEGRVRSVILFSEVEINNVERILLDYQSVTSVNLLKILLKKYWKINPVLERTINGFESKIKKTTAGLIIGDRALNLFQKFKLKYDLAQIWEQMTGLPFVFATWTSNKKLDKNFVDQLNRALNNGVINITKTIDFFSDRIKNKDEAKKYLTDNIRYNFGNGEKKAVKKYLEFMKELNLVNQIVLPD